VTKLLFSRLLVAIVGVAGRVRFLSMIRGNFGDSLIKMGLLGLLGIILCEGVVLMNRG
jgi:hypothetical protein